MKPILETNPKFLQFKQEIQEEEEEYGFNIAIVDYAEVVENDMNLGAEFYLVNRKHSELNKISNHFEFITDTVNSVNENVIEYGLANSITHFLTEGEIVNEIGSAKKVAIEGDLIISRLRSYLKEMAIVQAKDLKQVFSTEYLIYRRKNTSFYSSEFLLAFCLTNYVQKVLSVSQYGTGHPRFYETALSDINLPLVSFDFQERVERMVKEAHFLLEESKKAYSKAEEMLLMEVLGEWEQEEWDFFWIEDLEETKEAERLDAEYFHPKYKELLEKIKSYKHGFRSLGEVCEIEDANFNPNEDELYNYIELSSIDLQGGINEIIKDLGKNLPTRARRKVAKGDVIISSIEGSLDKVSLIDKEESNLLCSTGFYCINSKNIISEVLFLLAKSSILNIQFKRGCGGAILSSFSKQDLANATLPYLQKDFQEEVAGLVKTSFENRKRSRELLELAKKSVELAIEEGEEKAIQTIM